MIDSVFFAKEGEKGLNETSASHLCALASQVKAKAEQELQNICFVNTTITVVGSAIEVPSSIGITKEKLDEIEKDLDLVAKMDSFISWFAEARKALENYKKQRRRLGMTDWALENGIELPVVPNSEAPTVSSVSFEEVLATLSIKDRQDYLALEAKSAVYGKFIHPNNPMEKARGDMHKYVVQPYTTSGNGRDTIITHRTPSVESKVVDDLFVHLQKNYRQTEQSLNHLKSIIRKEQDRINFEADNKRLALQKEYDILFSEYKSKVESLSFQFNSWKTEEEARLSKIKFAIPEKLSGIVDYLNNLDN